MQKTADFETAVRVPDLMRTARRFIDCLVLELLKGQQLSSMLLDQPLSIFCSQVAIFLADRVWVAKIRSDGGNVLPSDYCLDGAAATA